MSSEMPKPASPNPETDPKEKEASTPEIPTATPDRKRSHKEMYPAIPDDILAKVLSGEYNNTGD